IVLSVGSCAKNNTQTISRESFDRCCARWHALQDSGDYFNAVEAAEEAYKLSGDLYSEEDPRLASLLAELGQTELQASDFGASEQYLTRALALRERRLGGDQPEVADSLYLLGDLYEAKRDLDRSLRLLERAFAIRKATAGEDTPEAAQVLRKV